MPVLVVSGPPCSGKTTYVDQHAAPDDIRIDYDRLAQALGSSQHHGHAEWFGKVTGKARWAAIKAALEVSRDMGATVWVIDSVIPDYRMRAYEAAGAEFVRLEVDREELHRRASQERPELWHQLIDDWAPTLDQAGPSWKPRDPVRPKWRPRPAYAKGMGSRAYQRARKLFLAQFTNCQNCGKPFVTDAPCAHPRPCRGRGCHHHPAYPTIQHTVHLASGGPLMDVSTWLAWCADCNHADGGRFSGQRQRQRARKAAPSNVDLSW